MSSPVIDLLDDPPRGPKHAEIPNEGPTVSTRIGGDSQQDDSFQDEPEIMIHPQNDDSPSRSSDENSSSSSNAASSSSSSHNGFNESGVMGGVPTNEFAWPLHNKRPPEVQEESSSLAVFRGTAMWNEYEGVEHRTGLAADGNATTTTSSPPEVFLEEHEEASAVESSLQYYSREDEGAESLAVFRGTALWNEYETVEPRSTLPTSFQEDDYYAPTNHTRHTLDSFGMEDLPSDEHSMDGEEGTKSRIRDYCDRHRRAVAWIALLLSILLLGIALIFLLKNEESIHRNDFTTTAPTATPPTARPIMNDDSPIFRLETGQIAIPVANDGYVNLGGILLREMQIQHTTTLLVQDAGFQLTAAVSILEFDSATRLQHANPNTLRDWLMNATLTLHMASHGQVDTDSGDAVSEIRLYARVYPNENGTEPKLDLDAYGFGTINFIDPFLSWIPISIIPNDTQQIQLDLSYYFLSHYIPSIAQATSNENDGRETWEWTNLKVLIVHDNTDGPENRGALVRFFSSEAETISDRPSLVLDLEPPRTPSPTSTFAPSTSPSVSLYPSVSLLPSTSPTEGPSPGPSVSPEPTYLPTVSPAPTILSYPVCSICDYQNTVSYPQASIFLQRLGGGTRNKGFSRSTTTCGALQQKGLQGEIPARDCRHYQTEFQATCCADTTTLVNTKGGAFFEQCSLCQRPDETILESNWNQKVPMSFVGSLKTCRDYQTQSNKGQISPLLCKAIQPYTSQYCCEILL